MPLANPKNLSKSNDLHFLSLFCALYVSTLILTMVVENRIILLGPLTFLSGTLIIPLSYALSDIITEVYGYKQMRRVIWISMICLYFCAIMISFILALPTDTTNLSNLAYAVALKAFSKDVITYSIAALLSIFLNAYILSKWKIMLKGRYFWLRSLGSMAIGEAIFIITWAILGSVDISKKIINICMHPTNLKAKHGIFQRRSVAKDLSFFRKGAISETDLYGNGSRVQNLLQGGFMDGAGWCAVALAS